jgi:L-histidine N-alpha-methyltransferase
MNFISQEIITKSRVSITNQLQEIGPVEVTEEIVAALQSTRRSIPSKYFYNGTGSLLFEEITRLEEYYPTRTEKAILRHIAPGLMKQFGTYDIIELGPGDHSKISILLQAATGMNMKSVRYLPLDISQQAIKNSAENLVKAFSCVEIEGYAADFTSQLDLIRREKPAMICFFGSTIGNFDWDVSMELLQNLSNQMKKGDIFLLGMDMIKPLPVLHSAYNDARGVTAAFNKNILNSVNNLIQSDFNTGEFDHLAFFNKEKSRIEMHLVAKNDLTVHSPCFKEDLILMQGESIHTENSHKYSTDHIREITGATGLQLNHTHTDGRGWFSVTEFQKS